MIELVIIVVSMFRPVHLLFSGIGLHRGILTVQILQETHVTRGFDFLQGLIDEL